ncbi:MAG: DinB family protein [Gemmatimonadetes bacterium]|nr:DinB family protein [Gemmatimonadota bacterium]
MSLAAALAAELEQEAVTTRRVLASVPDAHLAWTPHAKSRTLGQLAMHIAVNPASVMAMAMRNPASPPRLPEVSPASTADVLAAFDASVPEALSMLRTLSDAQLAESWSMEVNGAVIMTLPRAALLRLVLLSHWYHHRGQMSVYLRLLDVPVPSIYGPSADVNPFA